jgi:glycosyltransferase involved in cell wall biosynthesis
MLLQIPIRYNDLVIQSRKPSVKPLVSIVVPTRNSAATLGACLKSVRNQVYSRTEIIVVDNASTDATRKIAKIYTPHVYRHGPERSAQRNLGAARASGEYILFIDSDMELDPNVVSQCVKLTTKYTKLAAVIIPETSFGEGFWAQCKALERSYYNGIDWMESPRFMSSVNFKKSGGYDEQISGGEDWDLTVRLRKLGSFGRVSAVIYHNEGRFTLRGVTRKRFYYAEGFSNYYAKGRASKYQDALKLYALFFSHPLKALRHPIRWCGMIIMKTSELMASAVGYAAARRQA